MTLTNVEMNTVSWYFSAVVPANSLYTYLSLRMSGSLEDCFNALPD